MININLDTWLISDTHFFHDGIIKLTGRNKHSMDDFLAAWKELIKPEDEVLHLGDIFMGRGSTNKAKSLLPGLSGKKFFIRGNHDHESTAWYSLYGFTEVGKDSRLYYEWEGKRVLFSHYPDCHNYDWDINIHGHIHDGGYAPGTPKLDYRNICFEINNRPIRLREVLEGKAFQSRLQASPWPLSKIYSMQLAGKLDEAFCELERFEKHIDRTQLV